MAKRFTDTDKWKKAWYRKLGSTMRDVWGYLTDNCDSAGIWDIDLEVLSFFVGSNISLESIVTAFEGKISFLPDNKLFIPGFIEFQYGELSEDCKPHLSVIKRLRNLGLYERYLKGCITLEDKEKDKEEEKEKEKEKKGGVGENKSEIPEPEPEPTPRFDFIKVYHEYPRKDGKHVGLAACKAQIKTQEDYEKLLVAVRRYRERCVLEGTEKSYIMHFSTFMNKGRWKDYLDAETGTTNVIPKVSTTNRAEMRSQNNRRALEQYQALSGAEDASAE